MSRPPVRDDEGLMRAYERRIRLLERRLSASGGGGSGGGTTPYDAKPGLIVAHGSAIIPSGWLLCDGSAVGRTQYPELYQAIGTTWGAGDGSTTFNLPNLKGRALVGRDAAQAEFDVLGETGGVKAVTLDASHMAPQTWQDVAKVNSGAPGWITPSASGSRWFSNAVGEGIGSGQPHTNLQPYAVANYIISTGSGVGGGGSAVPALPDPWAGFWNATVQIDSGAGLWTDMVVGASNLTCTVTLAHPLWVMVEMSGYLLGQAGVYGMFGVEASGALSLVPEVDQKSGDTAAFGYTAFSEQAANAGKTLTAHKPMLLPAGTTTLKMKKRRSGGSAVPTVGYPTMIVTPIAWAGAPGGIGEPPPLPADRYVAGPGSTNVTAAAATWQAISGGSLSMTPSADLWVDVLGSAIVKSSVGYIMIGVNITGGLVLGPTQPPDGGAGASHWTPFADNRTDVPVTLVPRRVKIPKGVETTFAFWTNRSSGASTFAHCNYPLLQVIPVRWA